MDFNLHAGLNSYQFVFLIGVKDTLKVLWGHLKTYRIWYLFVLFAILEVLLCTWQHNLFGPYLSPLFIVAAGAGMCLIPVLEWSELRPPGYWYQIPDKKWRQILGFSLILTFLSAAVLLYFYLERTPAVVSSSDVIPQIQVLVRRFLANEPVYAPITEWGYTLHPTYVTGHWAVFIPPEILGLDYRMYALGLTAMAFFYLAYLCLYSRASWGAWFIAFFPWFIAWGFIKAHRHDLALTIESLPAVWYLVLTIFLGRKPIVAAIFAGLCLVSRYSLVLWLPFWSLMQVWLHRPVVAISTSAIALGFLVLFYVWPFLLNDPNSWQRGMTYHTEAALGEWKPQAWQAPTDKPFHLFRGLGLASWFHSSDPALQPERLALLQKVLFICLSAISVLTLWGGWVYRKRVPKAIILAGSLKLYLVVFYAFIQIPYSYLFWILLLVTAGWVWVVHRERAEEIESNPLG